MKHYFFKANYAKITTVILFVLVVLAVIMDCSNPLTTNNNRNKEELTEDDNILYVSHITCTKSYCREHLSTYQEKGE